MRPIPRQTPLLLSGLLLGGGFIFLLNGFFDVPVETAFAIVGIVVFLSGMMWAVVGAVWAMCTLASRDARVTAGLVVPLCTILIAALSWSVVILTAIETKKQMDAREASQPVAEHAEEMK